MRWRIYPPAVPPSWCLPTLILNWMFCSYGVGTACLTRCHLGVGRIHFQGLIQPLRAVSARPRELAYGELPGEDAPIEPMHHLHGGSSLSTLVPLTILIDEEYLIQQKNIDTLHMPWRNPHESRPRDRTTNLAN